MKGTKQYLEEFCNKKYFFHLTKTRKLLREGKNLLNRVMCSVISAEVEEERQALIVFRIFRFTRFLLRFIFAWVCVWSLWQIAGAFYIRLSRILLVIFFPARTNDRSSDINNSMNFLIASFFLHAYSSQLKLQCK